MCALKRAPHAAPEHTAIDTVDEALGALTPSNSVFGRIGSGFLSIKALKKPGVSRAHATGEC